MTSIYSSFVAVAVVLVALLILNYYWVYNARLRHN